MITVDVINEDRGFLKWHTDTAGEWAEEVAAWALENNITVVLKPTYTQTGNGGIHIMWQAVFTNEIDAVAFKLKWL